MNKNTIQVRFFATRDELRGIYEKAKQENRALTDDESKKVAELRGTIEQCQTELLIESCERAAAAIKAHGVVAGAEANAEFRQNFNKAVIEASQNGQPIPLRAATLIDKADAQPLVELTIGDIIGPLEKGMVLDKVGCKIQTGLTDDWAYPVVEAVEASIAGETQNISDSDIEISAVRPTPKRVAISVPVTRTAMVMTNDRLYDIVVSSLRLGIQRTLNRWMFMDGAVAEGAEGLFFKATTTHESADDTISYGDICALVGGVDSTGVVPGPTAAFVMSNSMKATLKATPRGNGDRMIIENDMIDGVPVFVTEYASSDKVYFGYFSYCLVGQFGDASLIVDPYTLAKKNQIQFTLNTHFDIKAARSQAFGTLSIRSAQPS